MEQNKEPVEHYYCSEDEWNWLGCGPLPTERDRAQQVQKCHVPRQSLHRRQKHKRIQLAWAW